MNILSFRPDKWWHLILGTLVITAGVSTSALVFLMQLPQSNCNSESESTYSASARIYCAISSVDEHNPEKLLRAIQLINAIPKTNPLRSNGEKLMTRWSQSLIELSEEAFHKGDLKQAIELLEQLPDNLKSYQQIPAKIQSWQSIWSQSEDIYQAAELIIKEDRSKNWYAAITKAKELKAIQNEYWAHTKYQQLLHYIQGIKEADDKHKSEENTAKIAAKDNSIEPELVENNQEKEDFARLKKARSLANSAKKDDLQNALMEASMVISDAHYQDSRTLIKNLENQIAIKEDKLYLEEAKKIASNKDDFSLEMAINEASLIGKDRPLYKQASQHIQNWKIQRKQQEKSQKSKLKLSQNIPDSVSLNKPDSWDISENTPNKSASLVLKKVDVSASSPDISPKVTDTINLQLEQTENQIVNNQQN